MATVAEIASTTPKIGLAVGSLRVIAERRTEPTANKRTKRPRAVAMATMLSSRLSCASRSHDAPRAHSVWRARALDQRLSALIDDPAMGLPEQ
jgi:hypothetical protein